MAEHSSLSINQPHPRVGIARSSATIVILCAILGYFCGLGILMQFLVYIGGIIYIVARIWTRQFTPILIRLLLIGIAVAVYCISIYILCDIPVFLDELHRKDPTAHALVRTTAFLLGVYVLVDTILIVAWLRHWCRDGARVR